MPVTSSASNVLQTENHLSKLNNPNSSMVGNGKQIHDHYLIWPDTPVRNVKRDIERLHVLLTSVTWKHAIG